MNEEKRGLDRKNRLYSILLAIILLACLLGYFIYMLPSLYVSYHMEQNLKSVELQHKAYIENGSYDGAHLANPTVCISIEIPGEGDSIFLTGQSWQMELTAKEGYARQILSDLQTLLETYRNTTSEAKADTEAFVKDIEAMADGWRELIKESDPDVFSLPVELNLHAFENVEYQTSYTKLHIISEKLVIAEAVVSDGGTTYTNYLAAEPTGDGMVFTILPAVMPDMNEIRPVVLESLPMLAAVVLLLVLVFSQMYSRGILQPVYRELEKKNQALREENERQEIFMRASSHQLKTPLSATLLLLDGMIGRVGKYKDTKTYLPKAKEQLLSMRKMVEDILSLNHCREHNDLQPISLAPLVKGRLAAYHVAVSDKQLVLSCTDDGHAVLVADEYLLTQIVDNLLSNAVKYTPPGEKIEIRLSEKGMVIENHGVTIPKTLLPHIFDPFVSGNHEESGRSHGLGLYIAAYYARQTKLSIRMENGGDSVRAVVESRKE
ncbi:MAG: HAMP domain-containing histidine kinase [Muribaculaceae bacterium]|nr:HAMP domain-containing histidine kinase [Roseburia sp.]MCM1432167.1 HAMP domain-containing histidine kinase [Muribaculaceae bacterium]MCM1492147.1 HAMP domain-containing histidine kinase [Muribaculaceae bacterium]